MGYVERRASVNVGDDRTPVKSADNALQIILMLLDAAELRVTDVSEALQVAPSTAHRLITTLLRRGFVVQDRVSKAYRAGPVLFEREKSLMRPRVAFFHAREHMQRLAEVSGETVNLMILEGGRTRFVDAVEGRHRVRVGGRAGTLLPAHATAGGKVLLAQLPAAQVREQFSGRLGRVTDRTITRFSRLMTELEAVRRRGYAANLGESQIGLNAVAVPIGAGATMRAAVAIAAPAGRMGASRIDALLPELARTAAAIGAAAVSSQPVELED